MPIWKRSRSSSEAGIDPTFRYETSWLLSPSVLFILRALFSLYAFTTIFTIFGYNNSHGQSENSRHSFSFFTNLTYWGLAFYYAFAALHTGSYWLKGQPFLSSWPRPLQLAHGMFYSTIVIFPFIVTIVYWALLYSGHFTDAFTTWSNTSQHALNSVYALFEIVFPRTKPLPFLTYATDDYFVYDFLDSTTNSPEKVAGYIIGILVAAVIIFLIIRYLIMLRVWFTEKPGRTGEFTTHRGVSLEEEAEKGNTMHDVSAK